MSSSERRTRPDMLADVAAQLDRDVHALLDEADAAPLALSDQTLRTIVTAAARLYARYGETVGPLDPLAEDVSPTEAIDLACGLLRARDLNPFDLALWYSRSP